MTSPRSLAARLAAGLTSALASHVACWLAVAALAGTGPVSALELRVKSADAGGVQVVELSGRFERGDGERVKSLLTGLPRTRTIAVEMSSHGGLIDEALVIGRFLHANGIRTQVTGAGRQCLSACALAFLGGSEAVGGRPHRLKGSEAKIGFHGFRRNVADKEFTVADMHKAIADSQKVMLMITDYMVEVDADIEFLSMMLEAPTTSMTWLGNDKAPGIGVHVLDEATGRITPPRTAPARAR